MESSVGDSLKKLSSANKFAVEFLVYTTTAILAERYEATGPIGKYLREVLMDAPSEIARRMINGVECPEFSEEDFIQVVNSLSDSDFDELAQVASEAPEFVLAETRRKPSSQLYPPGSANQPSEHHNAIQDATNKIEKLRRRIRNKRNGME